MTYGESIAATETFASASHVRMRSTTCPARQWSLVPRLYRVMALTTDSVRSNEIGRANRFAVAHLVHWAS
jgi:hypothetical protein